MKGYKPRERFSDGLPRAAHGIWIDLTKHQVAAFEKLAADAGKKSVVEYLTDLTYALVEGIVPSVPPSTES